MASVVSGVVYGARAADDQVVLIVGDSLSAGYGIALEDSWPSLLQRRLSDEGYGHRVVNASISGDTTAGGARRLGALLAEHVPELVVIALGANDGLRGIRPAEMRRNLVQMINATKVVGATPVLVRVRIPPNYGPDYTETFEAVFDELGADAEVVYAPFLLERFAARRDAFQSDGLHPTAEVQPDILDTLWPSISDSLSGSALEAYF